MKVPRLWDNVNNAAMWTPLYTGSLRLTCPLVPVSKMEDWDIAELVKKLDGWFVWVMWEGHFIMVLYSVIPTMGDSIDIQNANTLHFITFLCGGQL